MFILRVMVEIAAAHVLHGHQGKCARLHGHNWKIQAEVESETLNEIGVGMDFQDLKRYLREVTDPMDHQHLNELPEFKGVNPTAEHVAAHVYRELKPRITDEGCRLKAVTIWETDRSSVTYHD